MSRESSLPDDKPRRADRRDEWLLAWVVPMLAGPPIANWAFEVFSETEWYVGALGWWGWAAALFVTGTSAVIPYAAAWWVVAAPWRWRRRLASAALVLVASLMLHYEGYPSSVLLIGCGLWLGLIAQLCLMPSWFPCHLVREGAGHPPAEPKDFRLRDLLVATAAIACVLTLLQQRELLRSASVDLAIYYDVYFASIGWQLWLLLPFVVSAELFLIFLPLLVFSFRCRAEPNAVASLVVLVCVVIAIYSIPTLFFPQLGAYPTSPGESLLSAVVNGCGFVTATIALAATLRWAGYRLGRRR